MRFSLEKLLLEADYSGLADTWGRQRHPEGEMDSKAQGPGDSSTPRHHLLLAVHISLLFRDICQLMTQNSPSSKSVYTDKRHSIHQGTQPESWVFPDSLLSSQGSCLWPPIPPLNGSSKANSLMPTPLKSLDTPNRHSSPNKKSPHLENIP